jgi:hypothetical protein
VQFVGCTAATADTDQRVATTAPVLEAGRLHVRLHQRDLVRASLIARPPAGDISRDRRP